MKLCSFGTAVVNRDLDQQVLWVRFGVFHEHVEIAIGIKHSRIE
jgi:hypothetical protein